MGLNSRSLSFLISFIVATLTALLLSSHESASAMLIGLAFITAFLTTFVTCFIVLEFIIFSELRKIYSVFDRFRGSTIQGDASSLPIRKMSAELFKYANTKEQQIEKLKKLEAFRKEFLADISHELKTPIFSAQGFIHTLQDGAVEDEKVRGRFLKKAAKSLDELDRLVHDLLNISQLETGEFVLQMSSFNLVFLIEEIFEQLEVKARKKGVSLFIYNKKADDIIVKADKGRIEQVLKNLIVNAINYGYEKGEVVVSLKKGKNQVDVSVIDNGPGIPLEHQENIFRRFYRVDKSRSKELGGTGLGLSIVRHIIEAHESTVKLLSKPGKGTNFSFKLDIGDEESE